MIRDTNESLPREELKKLQGERLAALVQRLYANVPLYKQRLDDAGIAPDSVKGLADLANLPFTYKKDLRDAYPFNLFAVPLRDIVRIHASSGTTGKPTTVGYTAGDIDMWAECMARMYAGAGVTPDDIIQNAYGYGLFTGGLGAHYGGERLGAAVVPISGGNTQKQLMLLQDYGSTVLCSTPSFALYIWDVAREMGIDMASLPLRVGIFGAEPWSEGMRRDIQDKLNIKAIDIYGLSEIMGPGVSFECAEAQAGLHLNEDHFLAEIIDPETGAQLADGEMGELVITTLTKEGIPLLRYRTGDITRLNVEQCICGRTTARMDRVSGRSDDMLIIRGVNVFPSQVESVLLMSPEVEPHYRLIVEREGSMDTMARRGRDRTRALRGGEDGHPVGRHRPGLRGVRGAGGPEEEDQGQHQGHHRRDRVDLASSNPARWNAARARPSGSSTSGRSRTGRGARAQRDAGLSGRPAHHEPAAPVARECRDRPSGSQPSPSRAARKSATVWTMTPPVASGRFINGPKCARSPVKRCVARQATAAARIRRSLSGSASAPSTSGRTEGTIRTTASTASSRSPASGYLRCRLRRASSAANRLVTRRQRPATPAPTSANAFPEGLWAAVNKTFASRKRRMGISIEP